MARTLGIVQLRSFWPPAKGIGRRLEDSSPFPLSVPVPRPKPGHLLLCSDPDRFRSVLFFKLLTESGKLQEDGPLMVNTNTELRCLISQTFSIITAFSQLVLSHE